MPKIEFHRDVAITDGSGRVTKSFAAGQVAELSAASCRHHVSRNRARFVDAEGEAAAARELAEAARARSVGGRISAAARKAAEAAGLDLAAIPGSGKNGAVTKADVEQVVAAKQAGGNAGNLTGAGGDADDGGGGQGGGGGGPKPPGSLV